MSETEKFWEGDFGDSYTQRNQSDRLIFNNVVLFRKALSPTFFATPTRVIEFGANVGLNIAALRQINAYAHCEFTGVEVNALAASKLCDAGVKTFQMSMLEPEEPWGGGYDLVLSKGLLIHVPPQQLARAYGALYRASRRFIFLAEYHNPVPVEVEYRGHAGKLWKRDFAADMLDMFPGLEVRNVGFAWSRDPVAPQDDLVYTLFEKVA
jgi:spore coat polysaccharide biosynthesis protein SpsF